MLIEIISDLDSPSGYSSHARAIVKALMAAGINIQVVQHKCDRVTIQEQWLNENMANLITPKGIPDARIHLETPEYYRVVEKVINIGYTHWETNRIPRNDDSLIFKNLPDHMDWVLGMNKMDAIFTACESNKRAYIRSGVTAPIYVIPVPMTFKISKEELPIQGISVDKFGNDIGPKDRPIVIGSVAQWTWRKNFEDLISAVMAEFNSTEVILLLKTYCSQVAFDEERDILKKLVGQVKTRFRNFKNGKMASYMPNIVLLNEKLTDEEMIRIFNSIDIYCTTSRGEGFGIPPVQAMTSGCATVATGWSSFSDYVTEDTGWPIKYTMEPVFGMTHIPWYRPNQRWARVDLDHLCSTLRGVYNGIKSNSPNINKRIENGKAFVRKQFSPERIANLIENAIAEIMRKKS